MAETDNKVDLSGAGGGAGTAAGTGVGLAAHDPEAEAGFLDLAANLMQDAVDGTEGDEGAGEEKSTKKRKAKPKPAEVDDEDERESEAAEGEASDEGDEGEAGTESEDDEGDAGSDDEGENGEGDAKVSIRLNGKKADLEDILDHVGATVVVNGEDVEVTGAELISGYQRGKDYSEKTTELKQMKDDLVPYNQMVAYAKTDPEFTKYVQSYFQNGPHPELMNNPDLRVTDAELAKMMDANDASYDAERAQRVVALRSEWQEKATERKGINEKAQADMQARFQDWVKVQVDSAVQIINAIGVEMGFEDKNKKGEYSNKAEQVLAFYKNSSFNEAEIAGQAFISTNDARVAVMAYKASEYDRMVKESDAPRVTLGKKRKKLAPPRSQRSGSGTRTRTTKRGKRDSFRKATKSQSNEHWIDALEKRLN